MDKRLFRLQLVFFQASSPLFVVSFCVSSSPFACPSHSPSFRRSACLRKEVVEELALDGLLGLFIAHAAKREGGVAARRHGRRGTGRRHARPCFHLGPCPLVGGPRRRCLISARAPGLVRQLPHVRVHLAKRPRRRRRRMKLVTVTMEWKTRSMRNRRRRRRGREKGGEGKAVQMDVSQRICAAKGNDWNAIVCKQSTRPFYTSFFSQILRA